MLPAPSARGDEQRDNRRRRVHALTGASGSGKSTLLHLIGAIERPDSGTIVSGGQQVTALHGGALAAYRRTVGFVFQRFNLLPALTVLDNVIAPVLPYRTAFNKRERARALLAAVGLAGREHSLPSRMSGGEQQRVAVARALINTPSLLLADEPTGNLDSVNAIEILQLLTRLRKDHRMTIIMATHDPQVAARSDRARASRTSDPGGGTIDPGAACREHRVMTNASGGQVSPWRGAQTRQLARRQVRDAPVSRGY